METLIYFEENEDKYGVIRFVKNYRKKSFLNLRKELIEYTLSFPESTLFIDEEEIALVMDRIKKDYPYSIIYLLDCDKFVKRFDNRIFWVITHLDKNHKIDGYYSGMSGKKCEITTDINDAEISLDYDSFRNTLDSIRKATGEKYDILQVFLNCKNGLLEPSFMITCTSKRGKQETRYYSHMEGNRLRSVSTSAKAMKFSYLEVLNVFEQLQSHNKNFLYAVLPVFKDNVHCRDLEEYLRKNNVSRMVALTTKIKWLNR